jgi:hypothetical protein
MVTYRRVPQCRVCMSVHGEQIDKALVERVSYNKIVETFGDLFPDDKPLTKASVFNHFKHVKDAVNEAVAMKLATSRPLPATLDPNNDPHDPARQQVFQGMVKEQLNEIEVMEKLAHSALRDLDRMEPTEDDPEGLHELDVKLARNKIRTDAASITMKSAQIKQMAASSAEEQQRLEKGRIVFKMMDALRKAIEAVPNDLRPVIAEGLKSALRNDDELRDLLKVHQTKPKLAAGEDE